MVVSSEKREKRRVQTEPIKQLENYAIKALRSYEDDIENADLGNLSEREAINIAGNYVFGMMLISMHFADMDSIPWDEEDARKRTREYPRYPESKERGAAAKAINDALTGEYSQLKRYLIKHAHDLESPETAADTERVPSDLAQAILRLEPHIPDSSTFKFKPPLPPYLDPRFNPNASQPPPDMVERAGDLALDKAS